MSMLLSAPIRILIIAALCVAGLIGLVMRESAARARGAEIIVRMEAVDPRALLSGHYVIVALSETLPEGAACPAQMETDGDEETWLAFARSDDNHHRAVAMTATREEARTHGALVTRGMLWCNEAAPAEGDAPARPAQLNTDVGVDRFHIAQREAERIEALMRDAGAPGAVAAILSLGADGRARLKGLMVEGERLELTWD